MGVWEGQVPRDTQYLQGRAAQGSQGGSWGQSMAYPKSGRWEAPPHGYTAFRPLEPEEVDAFRGPDDARRRYGGNGGLGMAPAPKSTYHLAPVSRANRRPLGEIPVPNRQDTTPPPPDPYQYGYAVPAPYLFRPMDLEDRRERQGRYSRSVPTAADIEGFGFEPRPSEYGPEPGGEERASGRW